MKTNLPRTQENVSEGSARFQHYTTDTGICHGRITQVDIWRMASSDNI